MKSWFGAAAVLVMAGVVAACSSTGGDGGEGGEGGTDPTGTTGNTMTTGSNMVTSGSNMVTSGSQMTTSSTMQMDCGGLSIPDPTCQACLEASCCTELKNCDDEAECTGLITCQQGCAEGDQACIDACIAAAPVGAPLLDALDACLAGPCGADCGAGNGGICDSGLTFQDPACDMCLGTSCCDEWNACTGGTGPDGMPLDAVKSQECIDCVNGNAAPGVDCTAAEAGIACLQASCAAECGG